MWVWCDVKCISGSTLIFRVLRLYSAAQVTDPALLQSGSSRQQHSRQQHQAASERAAPGLTWPAP